MVVLRLLGGASLYGPRGPVTGRVTQRRRLALLAVLAAARGRLVSRDKLVALFWPDHESDAARHLLRDSLYVVRTALGDPAIVAAGDDLRSDPAHLTTDVDAFECALDAGDYERAVGLYTGPFLDGIHVAGAPEFDRWSEGERARLAERHRAALATLARQAERADRPDDAVVWWRRLAVADPLDGRAALGLSRALTAVGDRAAALQHVRVHTALLAHELGAAPDPALHALAEELQRDPAGNGGAHPTTTVVVTPAPISPEPSASNAPASSGELALRLPAPAAEAPRDATHPASGTRATRAARPSRARAPVLIALGVAAALGGVAAWRSPHPREESASRTVRLVLNAAGEPAGAGALTLTPDGSTVVSARQDGGGLLVRALGALAVRALAGTEGAHHPFVSPDGRRVGFFTADGHLEAVPLDGTTAPTTVATARGFGSASWGPGGVILVDQGPGNGLARIAATSGSVRALTRPNVARGEWEHAHPRVLSDGRAVVFVNVRQSGGWPLVGELAVAALDDSAVTPVPHTGLGVSGRGAVGVVDEQLVYIAGDGSALLAVPFDERAHRVTGAPVVVLRDPEGPIETATLAADGTLFYTRGAASPARTLSLVDARGARPIVHLGPAVQGSAMNPRFSPDGRRLAIWAPAPTSGSDVWVYDVASATPTRLTAGGSAGLPEWTPDGRRIVFVSTDRGRSTIWWQPADGTAPAERLMDVDGLVRTASVTPDGRSLVFAKAVQGVWSIWSARLDGDPRVRMARPVLMGPYSTAMPAVSPDGRWIAYTSSELGRDEVFVRPFPGPGAAVQLSDHGGVEPVWARDGRQLFYRNGRVLIAASIDANTTFVVTARDSLFRDTFAGGMPHADYAVTPDGRHFVMLGTGGATGAAAVVVVNWLPEFRAAVATGRPAWPP